MSNNALEDEFRRLHAETKALSDSILLIPDWPKIYTLHDACLCGDYISLKAILDNIFRTIASTTASSSEESDSDDEEIIMRHINEKDKIGRTPIHWACVVANETNSIKCIELLLDVGCRIDLDDDSGDLPVHGCQHGLGMQLLATYGADIGSLDRRARTPLMRAVERGNTSVVNVLVNQPWLPHARINDVDIDDKTALVLGCQEGHLQIVALLLQSQAEFQKGSPPPVVAATRADQIEIIRLLATTGGAALSQTDLNGWSALHWASDLGNLDAVEELTALMPSILPVFQNQEQKEQQLLQETDSIPTPLALAVARGHIHIVKAFKVELMRVASVAVAQGSTGSQYGVYSSWDSALKVLENEEAEIPPPAERVCKFHLFTALEYEAAEQYVELRSYAKKRDEDIVARLERERIAAELAAKRKLEEARLKAERKEAKKLERAQQKRLEGGGGKRRGRRRRRRGNSKSPSRKSKSPSKKSKSPSRRRRGRSKSPNVEVDGNSKEGEKNEDQESKESPKRSRSRNRIGRKRVGSKSPSRRMSTDGILSTSALSFIVDDAGDMEHARQFLSAARSGGGSDSDF
jgi:ankyrin repeat protein